MRFPPAPPGQVQCCFCGMGLVVDVPAIDDYATLQCPRCRTNMMVETYPALERIEKSSGPGQLALEGEATCFFHPAKRAAVVCDHCGRFLCTLCDLPVGTRHICPKCLAAGMDKEAPLPELLTKRVSWGRLSLLAALIPLLVGGPMVLFLFLITGPAAVFCALYGWGKPGSLVHGKRRISAVLGALLGFAEFGGVLVMYYLMWKQITHA